ncbi:MAG: succinate dehydrogenase cytochrome b subunit [Candidatus Zixiibacteriota bacterium]
MWKTSIGLKLIVAVTGVLLYLFVIGHMIGNLQVYLGPNALNTYAEKLRALPPLLWTVRIGLLVIAVVHITLTITLAFQNRAARPIRYVRKEAVEASVSSRTMVYSGLALLGFVVYHLLHLTWKLTNPQYASLRDAHDRPDVYAMVVLGFQNPVASVIYIAAMIVLGFHFTHAFSSFFQTVGWSTPRTRPTLERVALILAAIIVVGNISIPLSILLGVVHLPTGGM